MATQTHYIKAIARWAKVHKVDDKFGKHSIELGLTKDELTKFYSIGLKNKAKEADNLYWITLRRDPMSTIWVDGEKKPAGKPQVIDATGATFEGNIGNGSEVTVKFTVYDYDNNFGRGKGSRLESVRVDKLVEYKKEEPKATHGIPF